MEKILNFDSVTEELYKQIDITPTQYDLAKSHYEAVAKCLTEDGVATDVYTQGSFAFGTVIRPYREGRDADFDIDLVAQSSDDKLILKPRVLKKSVGKCLDKSQYHKNLLDPNEGRRCWTLNYAPTDGVGFHMDVLPCVHEENEIINKIVFKNIPLSIAKKAIAITDFDKDGDTYDWSTGNSHGLVDWFKNINTPYLQAVSEYQRRILVEKKAYASIEAVPEPLLKSSLQRVIQLFKRHRDVRFDRQPDYAYRPISIIITVLVAQIAAEKKLYNASVKELLQAVVEELSQYSSLNQDFYAYSAERLAQRNAVIIKRDSDGWHLCNPVNPYENFAERWTEDGNARAKAFFKWVEWIKSDFGFDRADSADKFTSLQKSFGEEATKRIYANLNLNATKSVPTIITGVNQPKPYRR
ncbi:MAG: nucleotidyltransferase [Christensenellales bacterium]|jgi:hypothetical protein